jgi:hypothetical protein
MYSFKLTTSVKSSSDESGKTMGGVVPRGEGNIGRETIGSY